LEALVKTRHDWGPKLRKIYIASMDISNTKSDMATLMPHVNSYAREVLGWATAYDLAKLMLPEDLIDGLGVERIDGNDVTLKPYLIEHAIAQKKKK